MEVKEFIEVYEKDGVKGIRGLMVLVDPSKELDPNSIIGIGIAKEDVKKGQVVAIKI